MITEPLRIQQGDIVKHFKHELLSEKEDKLKYLYKVINLVEDTTHNCTSVLYESLFDHELYIREVNEFLSPVDKQKYPNIKQKWRFEVV